MKARQWSVLLAIASAAFVIAAAVGRDSFRTVWGDESTYLAMAESLAHDGDLRFTAADAQRLTSAAAAADGSSSRDDVILQRTAAGIAYSKPVLYPLLAAPAVLLAGDLGPILLNLVLLSVAAWLAWLYVRRLGDPGRAGLTLVTFFGASVLVAHVGWRMTDLLQASLALAGLVLALACLRRAPQVRATWLDGHGAAWASGVLCGLLVTLRLPNALVVAAALAALMLAGRGRRALRVGVAMIGTFLLIGLASQLLTGTSSPYRAVRSSFDAASGYPLAADDAAGERFTTQPTTQRMSVVPDLRPRISAYAALYYWIGRHSGLLWYFPAVLALLATALRRPDRTSVALLLGAAASVGFYLVWWPDNYFGGSAFLGNRYFLAVYPLLLVALPRLPGRAALTGSWILAGVVGASALLSVAVAPRPAFSQSHAAAGLFARAPYESTARAIDGRRDRYWARDLVRFVTPEPPASEDFFVLESGAPAAEAMLVTRSADSAIVLRYETRGSGLEMLVEQGYQHWRYPLEGGGKIRHGNLTVPLAPAWRRHPFWWDEVDSYGARTVRFSVVGGEEGAPEARRRVRVWYGGDPAALDEGFEYLVHQAVLPERAAAGSTSELAVAVRNMSPVPWTAGGAFPVGLGYQLLSFDGAEPLVEGTRQPLAADLPSGERWGTTLPVTWPDEPGKYLLRVDLLMEDYAWFAVHVGQAVAERVVEVTAPPGE